MTFEEIKTLSDWIQYAEETTGEKKEAVYHYVTLSGEYAFSVLRLSEKKFKTGVVSGDRFIGKLEKKRKEYKAIYTGNYISLSKAVKDKRLIFIVEGEKDADTLNSRDFPAFTCGNAGEWAEGAADSLTGCPVAVLADNDKKGIGSAERIADALEGKAKSVKVIIPAPEIPGGDISDYFKDHSIDDFLQLIKDTPEYKAADSEHMKLLKASEAKPKTVQWLISGYMPRNQITIIAGDGGSGKTFIACDIAAAITKGDQSILTRDIIPADFGKTAPGNVLFLSGEDDFSMVLINRLNYAGADLDRVYYVPIDDEGFAKIKLGSDTLKDLIDQCRPDLVILDPLQQFLPFEVDMSKRNEIRQCLSVLISYGKKYGSSFLILCHSNKQSNNAGRKRIADSADIWDIARSVLIAGDTGDGNTHYLSHEKSNFGERQKTILYDLDGKNVIFRGRSEKKDADFIRKDKPGRAAPARQEAKDLIIQTLQDHGGKMNSNDLDRILISEFGMSTGTLKRAKAELKAEGIIQYSRGSDFDQSWNTELLIANI